MATGYAVACRVVPGRWTLPVLLCLARSGCNVTALSPEGMWATPAGAWSLCGRRNHLLHIALEHCVPPVRRMPYDADLDLTTAAWSLSKGRLQPMRETKVRESDLRAHQSVPDHLHGLRHALLLSGFCTVISTTQPFTCSPRPHYTRTRRRSLGPSVQCPVTQSELLLPRVVAEGYRRVMLVSSLMCRVRCFQISEDPSVFTAVQQRVDEELAA
jgi:hypothetical protein